MKRRRSTLSTYAAPPSCQVELTNKVTGEVKEQIFISVITLDDDRRPYYQWY